MSAPRCAGSWLVFVVVVCLAACDPNTALDPALPLRCGPLGECLDGFVCASTWICRAGASAEDDDVAATEDQELRVVASAGVLTNDRKMPGATLRAELVAPAEHGTVTLAEDGSFVYAPALDYHGSDRFTYRALVGAVASNPATVRIAVSPTPDAPRAEPDAYATDEDTPLVVMAADGVLKNDEDPDGDALTAIVAAPPRFGTIELAASGAFTYAPNRDFHGADAFTYRASDGASQSPAIEVVLTVRAANDAPVARDDEFRMSGASLEVPAWLGVLLNDDDVDGSPLAAVIATAPAEGTLTLRSDGSFSYDAPTGFSGAARFSYRVTDGALVSAPTNVTILFERRRRLPVQIASAPPTGVGSAASGDSGLAISGDGSLVAFSSISANLVSGDTNGSRDVFTFDGSRVERVSVSSAGAQGNDASQLVSLSADGRFVAFDSAATNLVAGDTNGARDVFVRDRTLRTTTRVSVRTGGAQASGASSSPSISADGRFVAFVSSAADIAETAPLGVSDVYVHDRQTGETKRVSLRSGGGQANVSCTSPSISAEGRFVAFVAEGAGLVDGDTNGVSDVFLHDRQTVATERISVSSTGVQGDRASLFPSVSADGSRVAFDSFATNFAPNDDNNNSDVFVRDRATGTTQLVSVSMGGGPGDDGSSVSVGALTRDGFEITFTSSATNLIPGDDNSFADVFVADLRTGAIRRVSVDSAGAQLAAPSGPPAVVSSNGAYVAFRTRAGIAATDTNLRDDVYVAPNPPPRVAELVSVGAGNPSNGVSDGRPSVSYDGRWIAFTTSASNFAVGDGNGVTDVYVRDRGAGTTRLVSVSAQGNAAGDGPSHSPSLSADGRFVAFVSGATNLVDGDANAVEDVFLRDLWRERTVRVSAPAGGTEANAASGEPSVCGAGVCVLFVSRATNLVQGTTSARARVYAFDPRTAELTLVSRAVDGGDPDDDSRSPSVSGDGRFVAFESSATNLVAGDTNGWPDIFVRDRVAGTTTRVSVATDGREADAPCISPALSLDGRFVVFATHATLEAPDNNGRLDLYLHDRSDGSTIRVTNGVVGASNGDSDLPSISGDGRFVLFSSGAPNLVAGDTNGVADVFVFERLSRAIVRVSETLLRQASSPSRENHLSGDGFALVFSTAADGLVPGDTNALSDIVAVVNPLY